MSNLCKTLGLIVVTAAMSGCVSHGPGGIPYSRGDSSGHVGVTSGAGSGAISGAMTTSEPQVEKAQRGNTPPGVDRDGHGPASGAIVDPTGAATRGKPY